MAKFSELRGGTPVPPMTGTDVPLRQALLTPAVATIVADGSVADTELDQLRSLCAASPVFREIGGAELEALVEAAHASIEHRGTEPAIAAAARVLSPALRRTALALAAHVAAADGRVDPSEEAILEQTALTLGIDDGTFDRICEVVTILHHGEDD